MRKALKFALYSLLALTLIAAIGFYVLVGMPRSAGPTPLPAGTTKVAEVEGVTEYRLENGLRVLIYPDLSKPTIAVNVTYRVGSRHEGRGETGSAHLLEHMLFKGSKNFPPQIPEMKKRGMNYNGTTWLDRTNYYEQFQASDENLEWALQMEADRMVNSFVAKKDLDSEMTVVRNEFEIKEDLPARVLMKRMQSAAFTVHGYGHPTIGARSDVENVPIENLQAFYRRHYRPDNAILIVSGKVNESKTLGLIAKAFGGIPRPAQPIPQEWTIEPAQDGERVFNIARQSDQQLVAVGYRVPSQRDQSAATLEVVDSVLNWTVLGRLQRSLIDKKWATNQYGSLSLVGEHPGLYYILATVRAGEPTDRVKNQIIAEAEGLATAPVSEDELQQAKAVVAGLFDGTFNDHEKLNNALSEYSALGDWRLLFLQRQRLQKVTAADVAAFASRYFIRNNRTVGMLVSDPDTKRVEMPAMASLPELLSELKVSAKTTDAEAFDPTPENISRRVTQLKVNGLIVLLMPKKNKGEAVTIVLRSRYGDETSLFGKSAVAELVADMLPRGSQRTGKIALMAKAVSLKLANDDALVDRETVQLRTTRGNLAETLKLVLEVMREPAFDAGEFEKAKSERIASWQGQLRDTEAAAKSAAAQYFRTYPPDDWRSGRTTQEEINLLARVTLDDVKKFHQAFSGLNGAYLSIVGDFDPVTTSKMIKELIPDWSATQPFTQLVRKHSEFTGTTRTINVPDKENGSLHARANVQISSESAEFPALQVASKILSDARLKMRVREKDGLSYSVYAFLSARDTDDAGALHIGAEAAPQNMARVESAIRAELAKALKEGFEDSELAAAKSGILQRRTQSRSSDINLAYRLIQHAQHERDITWDANMDKRIASLTTDEVNAAFRKHVRLENVSFFMALDQSKAKQK